MKLIKNIIEYIKREVQIRKGANKILADKEAIELARLEEEVNIPSAEKVLAVRTIGDMLRQDSERYHDASMKYLDGNPGKDFYDFDQLKGTEKSKYF